MSHRQTLRVAAAQYPIDQPATLDAWRDKIVRWVADGAATGAEVLVFPEYAAIEQAAALGEKVYGDLDATLQAVADYETAAYRFTHGLMRASVLEAAAGHVAR